MLIGLSPLLGPDLLHTLRAMGHGDEIALVDGNYPAAEHARRLIRADGIMLLPMLRAPCSMHWAARTYPNLCWPACGFCTWTPSAEFGDVLQVRTVQAAQLLGVLSEPAPLRSNPSQPGAPTTIAGALTMQLRPFLWR